MLTKTTFALIAALVLASASTAFAQSHRQNDVAPSGNPYSQDDAIECSPAQHSSFTEGYGMSDSGQSPPPHD
jgi:hypothetical protein